MNNWVIRALVYGSPILVLWGGYYLFNGSPIFVTAYTLGILNGALGCLALTKIYNP